MASDRATALALTDNLQRLMDHFGLSQAQLAKKSGVGQRTLSTLLDRENPLEINPRATTLARLAECFEIPSWQLLIPGLPIELLTSKRLTKLVEHYRDAPEAGRETVDRIAEAEVRYAAVDSVSKTGT